MQNEPWNQRLRHERIAHNWRQLDLAEQLGTAITTIQYWERGSRQPSAYFRTKLCALFGKSMQELGFGGEITLVETKSEITITKSEQVRLELVRNLHLSEPETHDHLETSFTGLPPLWNVPYPRNPFFTGREALLETLHERLTCDQVVALTQSYALHGLGGIGKTQLAVEYTYRYSLSYSAIWWVAAESEEMILSSFLTIAEHLQLPGQQDPDHQKIVGAVQRWLSTHSQWLLIWDNVEDFALIQRFLPTVRPGAILITTRRQALGTLAQGVELPQLSPEEGLLLLLRRAKVLSLQVSLQQREQLALQMPAEYHAAEQLVAEMDGLPLALDQAGAYIEETSCSLVDYLEIFQTRQVQLLRQRGDGISDHPASVAATWSLSFEKVEQANPLASDLLRLCAFLHPDAIPEELLLQGVSSANERQGATDRLQLHEAMRTVSVYSLLRRQREARTCSMHRLVQAVLRGCMNANLVQQWMERTVQVVHAVFPEVEHSAWELCERLVPHALICASYPVQGEQSHMQLASVLFKAASYLYERAQYGQAELLFQQVLRMREQALGSQHPDVARSLRGLANLYWRQGKYAETEGLHQQALSIFEQALGSQHPDMARSLHGLAMLYWMQGRYEQAEPLFQQALRIFEQTLGSQHPDMARSLFGLGAVYSMQEKYVESEQLYQRVLLIWEQALGCEHPEVAMTLNNLAYLYTLQGKYEQAEPLFQRTLHIWEKSLGSQHPNVAYALDSLATLYRMQGKYEQAEPLYRQSLLICEQTPGSDYNPVIAASLNGLALIYTAQSRYAEAEPLFLQVLALREHALGAEHFETADVLHDFATCQQAQGNKDQAASLYRRALAIREQALGADHLKTQQARERYIGLLRDMGQEEEATLLEH